MSGALELAVAWSLAAALGGAVLRLLVGAVTRARVGPVLCAATALALGVGLSSVLWLASALLFRPEREIVAIAEGLVVGALWWCGRRRRGGGREVSSEFMPPPAPVAGYGSVAEGAATLRVDQHRAGSADSPDPGGSERRGTVRRRSKTAWWLVVSAAIGVGAAAASFVAQARLHPLGSGDGLAIWGHRAVYLHRAFGQWDLVFSKEIVHTDYPLLVPASLARAWCFTKAEHPEAGMLLALLFGSVTFAALGVGVTRLRGVTLGALALLGLVATPTFVSECAAQAADVPLAGYTLLAAVWWRLAGVDGLRVGGACLGCCTWTKNEGALVALVMLAWLLLEQRRLSGRLALRQTLGLCLVGAWPTVAALLAFKLCWAPQNDLIGNQHGGNLVPMLTSLDRWLTIARNFGRWFIGFRTSGASPGLSPLVLAMLVLVGRRRGGPPWFRLELGTCLTMAAAIFLVFLLTPYDVEWHMATALDRVLLQTWPLALFGAACAVPDPLQGDSGLSAAAR